MYKALKNDGLYIPKSLISGFSLLMIKSQACIVTLNASI